MPSMTLQSIIDRAAAIADMDGDFVTPQTWVDWYNVEARALALFIARSGWVYNMTESQDNSSDYTITVPDEPLAILGVYEVRDGYYRPLLPQTQAEFTRQDPDNSPVTGDAQFYCATMADLGDDLTISLYPLPTSGTYRALFYRNVADATVADLELADTAQWPLGFEERIVLGMAKRALIREESDTRAVERLIAEQEQRIEEFCWNRLAADAPMIRNTDKVKRGWYPTMQFGRYESWYWL